MIERVRRFVEEMSEYDRFWLQRALDWVLGLDAEDRSGAVRIFEFIAGLADEEVVELRRQLRAASATERLFRRLGRPSRGSPDWVD
jgi:hypothetical protein